MQFILTHKDLLELRYWLTPSDYAAEKAKQKLYLATLQIPTRIAGSILEIGTGPHWGVLPHINAMRKTGIDPLYPAYYAYGLLEPRGGILQIDEAFERWDTNDKFDAIIAINSLDHGEMGFYLMPKISRLLKPDGRLYLHAHLRYLDEVNLIHDHVLSSDDLTRNLAYTNLVEEHREVKDVDVDGYPLRSLFGIWRKPTL